MNVLKYKHWPRGEVETRLSAKQLCTSSILVVASRKLKFTSSSMLVIQYLFEVSASLDFWGFHTVE